METPYTVQAEYSFKGSNNDELCFKKGDIITVTQREEGGWWEGTLGDKTGWFPSNYVKEYKTSLPLSETIRPPEEIQAYRSLVLNDLLESEKAHVAEIRGLLENFLEPLAVSQILTADEYAQLMCNFVEVVEIHEDLLMNIEDCNDRVGKLFLTKAPTMKTIHQAYCAAHPRAIVILDKYKDELETFMERQGAASPGLLVLTTGLSKPFRRLDKYSAMLQELERHMESAHPDRGDTQRSVAVYKEIASTCSATRRQKELELQVLTGPVRGWQGQELSTLGDIIHMGSVAVGSDHRDRYFVLFPQTLLILSVSQRMSAFIYEGKLPLTNIAVKRLEDSETIKNAFEVQGPLIEKIVAVCQGPAEANKWVDLLSAHMRDGTRRPGAELKRNVSSSAVNVPVPPPHMSPPSLGSSHPTRGTAPIPTSQHKRSLSFNHHLSYNQHQQQQQLHQHHQNHPLRQNQQVLQIQTRDIVSPPVPSGKNVNIKANWSITNLKPAPPSRPLISGSSTSGIGSGGGGGGGSLSSNGIGNLSSRKVPPTYEEDALVLRVIEAYCAAYQNSSRNTVHSALQPWTPCLPIRGGKLKSTKHFSTSNPQLPFICSSSAANANNNNSTSSLNSSYIWREASPNNFNLYSTSISSLNSSYRYSLGTAAARDSHQQQHPHPHHQQQQQQYGQEWRSVSEDKSIQGISVSGRHKVQTSSSGCKYKTASNYDNLYITSCNTPLLSRKASQMPRSSLSHPNTPPPPLPISSKSASTSQQYQHHHYQNQPMLYDRRANRSFEAPQELIRTPKLAPLRRSTPHLSGDDLRHTHASTESSTRNSIATSWCCGNFVLKQWRKYHNYD